MSRSLRLLPGVLAIARLGAMEELPGWAVGPDLVSATRTGQELTIVCRADRVPRGIRSAGPYRALELAGPIDLGETGVLASILGPLAVAGVPIFAISTFDTDYVLVPAERVEAAVESLRGEGWEVEAAA